MQYYDNFYALKDPLIKKVLETIKKFNMLKSGDRVLISISGGPDSTLLTYVFYWIKTVFKLELYGFCLDHLTRNGESTNDQAFVEELCENLDINLFKESVNAGEWARKKGFSFQEGARILRINFLEEIALSNKINKIAVGHNADDSMETFLMRILRGSGGTGLAGIRPVSGKIIRPLINIPRKDIEDFLEKNSIQFCTDRTNISNVYFRNRIRNVLIPFIEDNFSKTFRKNILRITDILRAEDDFFQEYAEKIFKEISISIRSVKNKSKIYLKIPISGLAGLHPAVRRRVIIESVKALKGDKVNLKFINIENVLKIAENPAGGNKIIEIFKDIKAVKAGEFIYFFNLRNYEEIPSEFAALFKENKVISIEGHDKKSGMNSRSRSRGRGSIVELAEAEETAIPDDDKSLESYQEIKIGERVELDNFDFILESGIIKNEIRREEDPTFSGAARLKGTDAAGNAADYKKAKNNEAYIDYESLKLPLAVRTWKRGDRFIPLGMSEKKKVHDFFIDNKVPSQKRNGVPIFFDCEKIVWLGGCRIDERVKITARTDKILHMKLFEK